MSGAWNQYPKATREETGKWERQEVSKGIDFFKSNQYDEAIASFKKASEITPVSEEAYLCWSACLFLQERYDEAIELFKKASSEIKLNFESTYLLWGECLREQKRYDEAIELFKKASSEIKLNFDRTYLLWGSCLREQGRYDEAIESFKKASAANPDSKEIFQAWGECLREQKRYNEAIELCKKAIEINSSSEDTYLFWGECLILQGQYDEAIEVFKKALVINPDSAAFYGFWGECLKVQEKYDEAIELFKKASEINPDAEIAYRSWGVCLEAQGRYDEAIELYKKASRIDPNSVYAYCLLGECLREQGRYDEAIESFKKASEANPDSENVYRSWAFTLMKMNHYDDALAIFNEYLLSNNDYRVIQLYGTCLLELKRYEEALKQFERLIDTDPYRPVIYLPYGQALEKLGNKEDALLSYVKYLRFSSQDTFIDLDFQGSYEEDILPILGSYEEYILPILEILKSNTENYVRQFYLPVENQKLSRTQLSILLILMNKYDIINDHIHAIFHVIPADGTGGSDREGEQDLGTLIFTIKLSIWLKLCEGSLYETQRLVAFYLEYIRSLPVEEKELKERGVRSFLLSLFILHANANEKIKTENVQKILDQFEAEDRNNIPFNDIFQKIWNCLTDPDSVEAQRYLADKAIAEVIEMIKSKNSQTMSSGSE